MIDCTPYGQAADKRSCVLTFQELEQVCDWCADALRSRLHDMLVSFSVGASDSCVNVGVTVGVNVGVNAVPMLVSMLVSILMSILVSFG